MHEITVLHRRWLCRLFLVFFITIVLGYATFAGVFLSRRWSRMDTATHAPADTGSIVRVSAIPEAVDPAALAAQQQQQLERQGAFRQRHREGQQLHEALDLQHPTQQRRSAQQQNPGGLESASAATRQASGGVSAPQLDRHVRVDTGNLPQPQGRQPAHDSANTDQSNRDGDAWHTLSVDLSSDPPPQGLYALEAVDIRGVARPLSEYAGNVTLVVNVASRCGYTDANYRGLQTTYEKYRKYGFTVLAFPCNAFGKQEPDAEPAIEAFCTSTYHTSFPLFAKTHVNGLTAHPVFQFLKRQTPVAEGGGGGSGPGKDIAWNFEKFLVNPYGQPVRRWGSAWDGAEVEGEVYRLLVAARQQGTYKARRMLSLWRQQ